MNCKELMHLVKNALLLNSELLDQDLEISGEGDDTTSRLIVKYKIEGRTKILKLNVSQLMSA